MGGYRNLIYRHITPEIESTPLAELPDDNVTSFYDCLRSQGLSARSIWCVHLLLWRCMDEAARDQHIPYNPVRLCQKQKAEEHKTAPVRLGQIRRYLNVVEKIGGLHLIYTGLSSGLRQCKLVTLSWADFHARCRYILKGQSLLNLNSKAEHLLKRIPETGCYVFLNPKAGAPYQLHKFLLPAQMNTGTGGLTMGGLPEFIAPVHGGGDMTLKDYILRWQEGYDKNQSRPTTYAAHGYIFKNHILHGLGEIPRSELTVAYKTQKIFGYT